MSGKRVHPSDALREAKTAASWFMRAVRALHAVTEDEHLTALGLDVSWLMGYEAERLIGQTLEGATFLIPLLDEEQLAAVESDAREFTSALRKARLAAKLTDTSGRTPEEAALFAAKADELRGTTSPAHKPGSPESAPAPEFSPGGCPGTKQ